MQNDNSTCKQDYPEQEHYEQPYKVIHRLPLLDNNYGGTITNLHIVLNIPKNPYLNQATPKNSCQNLTTPKNAGIKNF